jgi:hypothetical protein
MIIIYVIITVATTATTSGKLKRKITRDIVLSRPELSQYN